MPIASWLHALGVARFTAHHAGTVKGIPLQTWVFPQNRDGGLALFEDLSRRALAFFIDHVGPYSYEKLANVQAVGISGGMELASAIFYGEKDVAAGRAPGRPRDRAPVVWQRGDRARLGRCVVERGVCDLLRAAVHRAR